MSELSYPFVHLHVHSDFSLVKGVSKIKDIVARAKQLGQPAIGICDDDAMFGAFEFSKVATGEGIQPLMGVTLMVIDGDCHGSVTLYAQSETGFKNICRLLSRAHHPRSDGAVLRSEKGRPALQFEDLLDKGSVRDVILLSGSPGSLLWNAIGARKARRDQKSRRSAVEIASALLEALGDRFYIEVCRNRPFHQHPQFEDEKTLASIAFKLDIPMVGTTAIYYAREEQRTAYEIQRAITNGANITVELDGTIRNDSDPSSHIRSTEEMVAMFEDMPEAIENAAAIARRCGYAMKKRDPILPRSINVEGLSVEEIETAEAQELLAKASAGLRERLAQVGVAGGFTEEEYWARLEYEVGVISRMKFPGYFLIVADFIQWSIAQGIPVGPGRGSGAGSIVAYALRITNLDPMRFKLLFERFLNPDRVSMPDFDIDFCQDRRGEVIQYVRDRYGADRVAQIVTFMNSKSKTALKDTARRCSFQAMGAGGIQTQSISHRDADHLSKMIPNREGSAEPMTLAEAYVNVPEFRDEIESSPHKKHFLKLASSMEGTYRSSSTHAAGIVIAGEPLVDLVPVGYNEKDSITYSQLNMKDVESAGLVKFDFLGLKTLSIIRTALDYIRNRTGKVIDIDAIPLDDPTVLKIFADGNTTGLFQFESAGMKKALRSIKPTRFEELIAINALYRPGPMDQIPHFAACKHGEEEAHYPEPVAKTREFLEETFGIMVYQEQVMQVAQTVAGYTLGAADLLRRAMGKKIKEEMDKQREAFVQGAVSHSGYSKSAASDLFDTIAKFAEYGFNKSHAAAYSYVAYQTAWLKRYYPAEFFCALFSYEQHAENMALYKQDMDHNGIPMLPPNINRSWPKFMPEVTSEGKVAVRFGLGAVKGITGDMSDFLAERSRGAFKNLIDFATRTSGMLNKTQVERLADVGAFSTLCENRTEAARSLTWLAKNVKKSEAGKVVQGMLFGAAEAEIQIPEEIRNVRQSGDIRRKEFDAVGFWFGEHPIDADRKMLETIGVKRLKSYHQFMMDRNLGHLDAQLCVLVEHVYTKTFNNRYALMCVGMEQENRYEIPFWDLNQYDRDATRSLLEDAKKQKTPIVIGATLQIDPFTGNLRIKGTSAAMASLLTLDIQTDLFIKVDLTNSHLDAKTHLKIRDLLKAGDEAGAEEVKAAFHATRAKEAGQAIIKSLMEYAVTNPDEGHLVQLQIIWPGHKKDAHLPGAFRITADGREKLLTNTQFDIRQENTLMGKPIREERARREALRKAAKPSRKPLRPPSTVPVFGRPQPVV